MVFEYRSIQSVPLDEKQRRLSTDSASTLHVIGDLDYLSQESGPVFGNTPFGQRASLWLGSKWILAVNAILFLSSCGILAISLLVHPSTLYHVQHVSAWSPADKSVRYEHVRYNITTQDNPFVGAGPEVDKAWREISYDMGDQWISKADLPRLDMPVTSLTVDHPTTGEEGYRVGMEVFHHLHCLNLLRRVTYKHYYEPLGGEFGHGPEALKMHTDHCIEVLRQNIQCNADIGLFTFYMVPGDPLAWPQLNSKHVCRNFDAVRQWAIENSVGNMEIIVDKVN
ncbi:hypothetical protein F5884DRAFT_902212 [Xylogone sp. PMI_703]|nr:hypothetical protein F5884DRAFT_902212 [Xylogone sp. PMI_703]